MKKSIQSDAMVTPADNFRRFCPSPPSKPSVLVALPFKLGVSLTEISVVFSPLSIYLSSGCIDWKLNNGIVKKQKNGLLKDHTITSD